MAILQRELRTDVVEVLTDTEDPSIFAYEVFNQVLNSKRVHVFGIRKSSDIKQLRMCVIYNIFNVYFTTLPYSTSFSSSLMQNPPLEK